MPTIRGKEKKREDPRGHRKRLREKFLKSGFAGFHDYEVVELLLSLATPRSDCKPQAKTALKKFKSLKGVFEATPEQLREIDGIGPRTLFGIKLVKEASNLYLEAKAKAKPHTSSPDAVYAYLRQSMGGLKREVFKVLYLNNANEIIETEELFQGTVDRAAVHPREVISTALKHNANRLIFSHNHTGGNLRPSRDDLDITKRLREACETVELEVLDHIIVTGEGYFSFKEHNLL